jgi:hypothetical protein
VISCTRWAMFTASLTLSQRAMMPTPFCLTIHLNLPVCQPFEWAHGEFQVVDHRAFPRDLIASIVQPCGSMLV